MAFFFTVGFSVFFYWESMVCGERMELLLHFCLGVSVLGWFHKTSRKGEDTITLHTVQTDPTKPISKGWVTVH